MAKAMKSKAAQVKPVLARSRVVGGDSPGRGYSVTLPTAVVGANGWNYKITYEPEARNGALVLTKARKTSASSCDVRMTASMTSIYFPVPAEVLTTLGWVTGTNVMLKILPEEVQIYRPSGNEILMDNLLETWLTLHSTREGDQSPADYLSEVTGVDVQKQKIYRWQSGKTSMPAVFTLFMVKEVMEALLAVGPILPETSERLFEGLSAPTGLPQD